VTLYSMLSHEEKAGMQVPPDDVILSRRRHLLDYRVTSANSLINVLFSRYLVGEPLICWTFFFVQQTRRHRPTADADDIDCNGVVGLSLRLP
jgi:hypothetical protein